MDGTEEYQSLHSLSGENGHFSENLILPKDSIRIVDRKVHFTFVDSVTRKLHGYARLLHSEGISIISDVDDTIKISNVMNKKELMANSFMREFIAVEGMAEVYQAWEKRFIDEDVAFHYVSASPYQLFKVLHDFLQETCKFPEGTYHMKMFGLSDSSFLSLFEKPNLYKISTISVLMKKFPRRKFILVGDSGEKDPEAFVELAKQFPNQVLHIFIRNVHDDNQEQRYYKVFGQISKDKWTLFKTKEEINNLVTHSFLENREDEVDNLF